MEQNNKKRIRYEILIGYDTNDVTPKGEEDFLNVILTNVSRKHTGGGFVHEGTGFWVSDADAGPPPYQGDLMKEKAIKFIFEIPLHWHESFYEDLKETIQTAAVFSDMPIEWVHVSKWEIEQQHFQIT